MKQRQLWTWKTCVIFGSSTDAVEYSLPMMAATMNYDVADLWLW